MERAAATAAPRRAWYNSGMPRHADGDQDLVTRLQAGDQAAVEDLAARFQARTFSLAYRLTGNREDAQEVLQDVLLTVIQKIHAFRGEAKLSSWIYRIATNAALMKLRKRPKAYHVPIEDELGPRMDDNGFVAEPVADWSADPSDEAERRELGRRIHEAIQQLPPEYRSVVVLRDVEGLSAEEAAEVLELSVPALKSRLHRARLFLRHALTAYATGRPASAGLGHQGGGDAHLS